MPSPVSTSQGPPADAWTGINSYSGDNQEYIGQARSFQPTATLTVVSVSKANPAVVTVTAHGLQSGNTVDIAGGTGDWAGINGNQLVTVIDANTFSIAVNTTAYASTFAGTITTNSPRTGAACWSIQKFFYVTTNLVRTTWADGNTSADNIWDNRTSLKYL